MADPTSAPIPTAAPAAGPGPSTTSAAPAAGAPQAGSSASSDGASQAPTPTGSSVKLPIGQEFQVAVHHQSIAEELGADIKAIEFKVETDLKNGWHKLTGWIK